MRGIASIMTTFPPLLGLGARRLITRWPMVTHTASTGVPERRGQLSATSNATWAGAAVRPVGRPPAFGTQRGIMHIDRQNWSRLIS